MEYFLGIHLVQSGRTVGKSGLGQGMIKRRQNMREKY